MLSNFLRKKLSKQTLLSWALLLTVIGLLVGSVAALFLVSLDWIIEIHFRFAWMFYLLPLGGLIIANAYFYGNKTDNGNAELQQSAKQYAPLRLIKAPLVFFGTLITHLMGGSAGREGTAVQMGGVIADASSRQLGFSGHQASIAIQCGMAAGFAAVFGTPWAGIIFAFEYCRWVNARSWAWLPTVVAAFLADFTCTQWGVYHTSYPSPDSIPFHYSSISKILLLGAGLGIAAYAYRFTFYGTQKLGQRIMPEMRWRIFAAGIILVIFYQLFGLENFRCLGIPIIQNSFFEALPAYTFLLKLLLTAFTLGMGFKGGEATPLFFVGACLGNTLAQLIGLPLSLGAACGFIAVFGAFTKTPWASFVMGLELFDTEAWFYLMAVSLIAYYIYKMADYPIYSLQKN